MSIRFTEDTTKKNPPTLPHGRMETSFLTKIHIEVDTKTLSKKLCLGAIFIIWRSDGQKT